MIAQHAHICLEAEKSLKTQENSSVYIQYANELWNSIVFLSHTIINKSRSTLVDSGKNVSSKILIDSISAIYLLENNTSLKKLFQEFISSRTVILYLKLDLFVLYFNLIHKFIESYLLFYWTWSKQSKYALFELEINLNHT